MTRSIRLSIAPATAATCGDGSGKFCRFLWARPLGKGYACAVFHDNIEMSTTDGGRHTGWILRWPEYIAAEDLAPR